MTPVVSTEYQSAVEEAANAFMKVMALRGFEVRDYPQNFVGQISKQTRLDFQANRLGAHPQADSLVSQFIQSGQSLPQRVTQIKPAASAFPSLRRRLA